MRLTNIAFSILLFALFCANQTFAQDLGKPVVDISDEAWEIHNSGMLFDGHNDLPWAMRTKAGSSFDKVDISKPTEFHTDIPRLKKGGLKAQFWSVYVPAGTDRTGTALIQTLEQIQIVHEILGGNVLRALKKAEAVSANLKKERAAKSKPAVGKKIFSVTVAAGEYDRTNSIVRGLVNAGEFDKNIVTLAAPDGTMMLGQLSAPGLGVKAKENQKEITFVLPKLAAGQSLKLEALDSGLNANSGYAWHDDGSQTAELQRGESPVLKYMYENVDDSTKDRRYRTMKVFHHVYTPNGSRLMTKGPGDGKFSKLKDGGLFSHHRGLFYGFNRISYEKDGKKMSADVWHCRKGESQTHEKTIAKATGPVFGRHTSVIYWRGQDGEPFAHEIREMTAYDVAGTTLVEFKSSLDSTVGKLALRGDPQHAGFQFRASQDVPDLTKKKTYYIRPDGVAKPGDLRNWSNKKDETEINLNHINLPWNTVVIELPIQLSGREAREKGVEVENRPFSISYLDSPKNPKPSRFSERDYARFGSYFEFDLDSEKMLNLNYQVWIQNGVTDVKSVEAASKNFTAPVVLTQD